MIQRADFEAIQCLQSWNQSNGIRRIFERIIKRQRAEIERFRNEEKREEEMNGSGFGGNLGSRKSITSAFHLLYIRIWINLNLMFIWKDHWSVPCSSSEVYVQRVSSFLSVSWGLFDEFIYKPISVPSVYIHMILKNLKEYFLKRTMRTKPLSNLI